MDRTHLNPDGLHSNPAFTQAVKVTNPGSLVFIGGQNGETAVQAAGGSLKDIVTGTILVTDPAALGPGFAAFQELWGEPPNPPAISVRVVAGLANPSYLVEVEAIAAIAL